jgi:hypothetical protein
MSVHAYHLELVICNPVSRMEGIFERDHFIIFPEDDQGFHSAHATGWRRRVEVGIGKSWPIRSWRGKMDKGGAMAINRHLHR